MIISTAEIATLFDFAFNPWALFSVWSVIINAILLYFIITRGFQVAANRWFALVILSLIVWGFFESLDRFSATPVGSDFWGVGGMMGWGFVGPLFLGFTLLYIGKDKIVSNLWVQLLMYGPAFIFLFLGWTTGLINNRSVIDSERLFYGWELPSAPYFWLATGWLVGLLITSLYLLVRHWMSVKDPIKRKQTAFFILAVSIPVIFGSITNALLPVLGIQIFPAAVLLTSVMSLIITYSILRYKLFVINPSTVVTNIVDTMNEMLIVFNPDHIIQFTNRAVGSALGYGKDELVGEPFKKILRGPWATLHERLFKQVHEGKAIAGIDLELVAANGEVIPVSLSASPLRDKRGGIFGIVGVATDISKIRDLFADITAERNKLTTTIESIADGVLALDYDGVVITINPAALRMFGFSMKDVMGKKLDDIAKMFEGDKRILFSTLITKKNPTKDTVVSQKENLKIITNFGKQVYVDLTSSAIKEGQEVGLGAIITVTDISGEKELEEMKLDFVSMAAHELRTPLTAIRGYLSVLQEELTKALSKEQQSFLDKAFISSTQLAALVENLLSVSRIERGAMKIETDPQNWKDTLEDVVTNFMPLAKEKDIKLLSSGQDNLPSVMVDKFRISEVLSNLVGNALNYTDPGGSVEISAKFDKSKNMVVTTVKDTGQGIPESAIPHLFTKFFRVSGVLEQGSKGTGLGLYISKAIITMHRGDIWVESKIGKGSTFRFTIPVSTNSKSLKPTKLGTIKPKNVFVRKNNVLKPASK